MIPATVLLGSMAAGGLGLYLSGSTGSEPSTGIAKTVEDSVTSIADQVSKTTQDVTEYVSPKEEPEVTAPEPVAEPVPEAKPETLPETEENPSSEENPQRGGYGRPTWAPVRAQEPLIQVLGLTNTPAANIVSTVTGSRTPQQIQQELVEVDRQLRTLRVKEFNLSAEKTTSGNALNARIQDPSGAPGTQKPAKIVLNAQKQIYLRNKTLYDFNTAQIAKLINKKDDSEEVDNRTYKEQYKEFYASQGEEPNEFDDKSKKEKLFKYMIDNDSKLPSELKVKGKKNKNGSQIDTGTWWGILNQKPGGSSGDAGKLGSLVTEQGKAYEAYSNAEYEIDTINRTLAGAHDTFEESSKELKEVSTKIKEFEAKRSLLLEELSKYQPPSSFWDSKQSKLEAKPLPSGEELSRLMAKYKDIEEQIKEKQEEIDDYISNHLSDETGYPLDDQRYVNLTGTERAGIRAEAGKTTMVTLKAEREKIIAEIEGRSVSQKADIQKEIENVRTWKDMVRKLELDPKKEKKYLDPKTIALFSAFEMMIGADESVIEKNIKSYYDTFSKGSDSLVTTSGLTTLLRIFNSITEDSTGSECKWKAGDEIVYDTADSTSIKPAIRMPRGAVGNNVILRGTVVRVRNMGEKVNVCTELRIKVSGTYNVIIDDTVVPPKRTRERMKNTDNNGQEFVIDLMKGTTKYDLEKLGDKKPFETYKANQEERLIAFIAKLKAINEDLNPKSDLKKKIGLLEKQLTDSALPYFSLGTVSFLNIFGKGQRYINGVIQYLKEQDLRTMLQTVGNLLFASLPSFFSEIIQGIKDYSEIRTAISQLENLISDTAITMGRNYQIPDAQKAQLKRIITELKKSSTTLADRKTLLATTKAFSVELPVLDANGQPTAQMIRVTVGEEMVKYNKSIWARLKESFGSGIGLGALPSAKWELCGRDDAGAVPFLATLVTGGTVQLFWKRTDISGENDEVKREAKGSMTSTVCKLVFIDGFVTLPLAVLVLLPGAMLYSIYSMISGSIRYVGNNLEERARRINIAKLEELREFNRFLPEYLQNRDYTKTYGTQQEIEEAHRLLVAEVRDFLGRVGDNIPPNEEANFRAIILARANLDSLLGPKSIFANLFRPGAPAAAAAAAPVAAAAAAPGPQRQTFVEYLMVMLAQLGQAIRNAAVPDRFRVGVKVFLDGNNAVTYTIRQVGTTEEGDKVYTIEDGAGVSRNNIPEDRLTVYTAPPRQPVPDPAAARAAAEAARLAAAAAAAAEAAEAARLAAEAAEAENRERLEREAAAAAEAARLAAEAEAAAAAAEVDRLRREREAEEAAAAAAAAAGPGAAGVGLLDPPPPPPPPPPAGAVVDPPEPVVPGAAPPRQWTLGLPVISFYALFDENSALYNCLKYIFQAFAVFKTWEFNFETWTIGDKASAEEWEKFSKETWTLLTERPEITDSRVADMGVVLKGKESNIAGVSITEDEKQYLRDHGINSLQDFNLSILQTTESVWKTGNNILSKVTETTKDIDAIYDKIDAFVDLVGMKFGQISMFAGGIVLAALGNIGKKGNWSELLGPGWENVSNILGFFAYSGLGLYVGLKWVGYGIGLALEAGASGVYYAFQAAGQGFWFAGAGLFQIASWVYNSLPEFGPTVAALGAGLLFIVSGAGTVIKITYQFTIKALTAVCIPIGRFIVNIGVAGRTIIELTKLMFTTVIYGAAIPIWTVLVWGGYGIVYKGVVWGLIARPIIGTIKIIWMLGKNTAGRFIWKSEDLTETSNWFKYFNYGRRRIGPAPPPAAEPAEAEVELGGGYTRRQRVRGMPKRLKTRRTY